MAIGTTVSSLLAAAGGVAEALGAGVGPGTAPDALELLHQDHEEVKRLFSEVLEDESSALSGARKKIDQILTELELHAKLEETLFYPALAKKSKRDTEDRQQVLEAYEEHGAMKDLIRKIKRSTGRDETLRAKVQVLKEIVEHHVEEEESSIFDEARRLLNERALRLLGEDIVTAKDRAARSGARGSSRKKPAGAKKSPATTAKRRKKSA